MEVNGTVAIKITNAETGEVREQVTSGSTVIVDAGQDNSVVTDYAILQMLNGYQDNRFPAPIFTNPGRPATISLSVATNVPKKNNPKVGGIIATGFVPPNTVSPDVYRNVPTPYGEIHNRILFTGATRTFSTVCLGYLASANSYSSQQSTTALAYVLLATPCSQGPTDIIDILYRVQIVSGNGGGLNVTPHFIGDFIAAMFGVIPSGNTNSINLATTSTPCGSSGMTNIVDPINPLNYGDNFTASFASCYYYEPNSCPLTQTVFPKLFKIKMERQFAQTERVGRIINSVLTGCSDPRAIASGNAANTPTLSAYNIHEFLPGSDPQQLKFSHSSNATTPFYDPQTLASGTGDFNFSGTWNGIFPTIYKIRIVNGGNIGTASYTLSTLKTFGFTDNNWIDILGVPVPLLNSYTPSVTGIHGWRKTDKTIKYNKSQIVQYDASGITLLDVFFNTYHNWDSNTNPSLNVANIHQVAVSSTGNIYVACSQNGLFKCVPGGSVTQLRNVPCYGVDVGRNDRVFAVFNDGLFNSDSWTTSLTFSYSDLTPNNFGAVLYLKVDPENVNDNLAIAYSLDSGTTVKVVWWSLAGLTAIAEGNSYTIQSSGTVRSASPNGFDVSDTGSHWVLNTGYNVLLYFKLNWGVQSNSDMRLNSAAYQDPILNGYVCFIEENLFTGSRMVNVTTDTFVSLTMQATDIGNARAEYYSSVYLGEQVLLLGSFLRVSDSGQWQNYGWDGTTWMLGNTNAKLTHADTQTALDGLSLSFVEGTSSRSYTATDYYTQAFCYGKFKTNVETLYYKQSLYYKPLIKNQTLAGTIPATPPYAVAVPASPFVPTNSSSDLTWHSFEYDALQFQTVQISGYQSAAQVLSDGNTLPGSNQVSINPLTGIMTFNSADAGKTLSGTYAYVSGAEPLTANHPASPILYPLFCPVLNFDADSTADSSSRILTVTDESPYAFNATAPTDVTLSPVKIANGLGTKSVGRFDGTKYLNLPVPHANFDPSAGFTCFALVKPNNSSINNYCTIFYLGGSTLDGNGNATDNNAYRNAIGLFIYQRNFTAEYWGVDTINDPSKHILTTDSVIAYDAWGLISFTINDAGNFHVRYNGIASLEGTITPYPLEVDRRALVIGQITNENTSSANSYPFYGDIAFFSLVKTGMTVTEMSQVEKLIAAKFPAFTGIS